ncbi:phage holin family protein [Thioclava sp. FR2]|uniref:phage holin family protein n=1 Tax=Thioclava sp. FR2 TaxID=3445780 RepID=UPI003EC121B7
MGILDEMVHSIGRDVRMDVRKLLLPVLLALAGGLIGATGVGFLTAWAYLTLGAAIGHGSAALVIGLGYLVLSAGLVLLAQRQLSKHDPDDPSMKQPGAQGKEATDAASEIAFTAAFVLARYLGKEKRD